MANDNKMELVVEVAAQQANAALGGVNTKLGEMERSAIQAARGSSTAMDGMTASMVKGATAGALLADTIRNLVSQVKDWSIGAAQAAAHVERLEVAMMALARANGIAGTTAKAAVEAIRKVGFTDDDALVAANRLIISRIGLQNAAQIAQIAKNAAGVGNISAPDALEGIIRSVEFGQARGLRAVGINVDFAKAQATEEEKLGRTLTQNEEIRVRYNAIVRESAKTEGVAAEVAKTAEGQMNALKLQIQELKDSIGRGMQTEFKQFIGWSQSLVGFLAQNRDGVVELTKVVVGLGVAFAAMKVPAMFAGGMSLLGKISPTGLLMGSAALAGMAGYEGMRNGVWGPNSLSEAKVREEFEAGGIKMNAAGAIDMSGWDLGFKGIGGAPKLDPGDDLNGTKLKLSEIRKMEISTAKEAATAWAGNRSELAKIIDTGEARLVQLREEGHLNETIRKNVVSRMDAEWVGMNKAWDKKQKDLAAEKFFKDAETYADQHDSYAQGGPLGPLSSAAAAYTYGTWQEAQGDKTGQLGMARDARMRSLELADSRILKTSYTQTIRAKTALEQDKLAIEIDYLRKSQALQEQALIDRYGEEANGKDPAMRAAIEARRDQEIQRSQGGMNDAIAAAQGSSAVKQAQNVRDEYQKSFDQIKNSAGSLFDALITNTKSFGQTLIATLRTALLTPIKEALSTWIAGMLMGGRAFMGGGSSYGGGSSIPTAAAMGGLLMGGTGGYDGGAGMASGGSGSIPGIMSGGMGGGAALAGLGSIGAMGGSMGGSSLPGVGTTAAMGGIFSKTGAIGGLGARAGMSGTAGLGMMGLGAGALGIYGGAKLAGMDSGWAKGGGIGIAGLGGAIAGGSLMAMFPSLVALGMAVPVLGAAIGVGIALYMAFGHKSPEQKMKDAVKAAYQGLSIDTPYAKSLVERAGGMDYRVFLQRPDIQQEISLYRQMTQQGGNASLATDNIARGVSLQQSGGSLYQAASYYGGGAYGYQSTLPSMGNFQSLAPTMNVIQLDGRATTAALGGAVVTTTSQSQGRTQLAANLMSPTAVLI